MRNTQKGVKMTKKTEKLELLSKNSWNNSDIALFLEVGYAKATSIRKKAATKGCQSFFDSYRVDVDKFLNLMGTSRQEQIDLIVKVDNANTQLVEK